MDWKLELIAIPVADVDRAKALYAWQAPGSADHDHEVSDEIRFVQVTPPGSAVLDRVRARDRGWPTGSRAPGRRRRRARRARGAARGRCRGRPGRGLSVGLVRVLRGPGRQPLVGAAGAAARLRRLRRRSPRRRRRRACPRACGDTSRRPHGRSARRRPPCRPRSRRRPSGQSVPVGCSPKSPAIRDDHHRSDPANGVREPSKLSGIATDADRSTDFRHVRAGGTGPAAAQTADSPTLGAGGSNIRLGLRRWTGHAATGLARGCCRPRRDDPLHAIATARGTIRPNAVTWAGWWL